MEKGVSSWKKFELKKESVKLFARVIYIALQPAAWAVHLLHSSHVFTDTLLCLNCALRDIYNSSGDDPLKTCIIALHWLP